MLVVGVDVAGNGRLATQHGCEVSSLSACELCGLHETLAVLNTTCGGGQRDWNGTDGTPPDGIASCRTPPARAVPGRRSGRLRTERF